MTCVMDLYDYVIVLGDMALCGKCKSVCDSLTSGLLFSVFMHEEFEDSLVRNTLFFPCTIAIL